MWDFGRLGVLTKTSTSQMQLTYRVNLDSCMEDTNPDHQLHVSTRYPGRRIYWIDVFMLKAQIVDACRVMMEAYEVRDLGTFLTFLTFLTPRFTPFTPSIPLRPLRPLRPQRPLRPLRPLRKPRTCSRSSKRDMERSMCLSRTSVDIHLLQSVT